MKRDLLILLACCPCVFALDPSLDINQYAHKAWTVRDGFFKGVVQAIAQTPDGYLWLGTEFGLLQFDGVRAVPWSPPAGQTLPSSNISRLLVTRDGRVWIGTRQGLASWKDGGLTQYPEIAGQLVAALLEDHQGTTWVGTIGSPGRLCAIHSGTIRCYGSDGSFGRGVLSLYEYKAYLWAGAITGLWRWTPESPKRYPLPGPVMEPRALIEGEDGSLWIAMPTQLLQFVDGRTEPYQPPSGGRFGPDWLLRDREGGLWIGTTTRGVLHLHGDKTDQFGAGDGLSGDFVGNVFEDREGNIWVATLDGLDRFRDYTAPTISVKQGLSNATVVSVLARKNGSVWIGTSDGLTRWSKGQITTYRTRDGLPSDAVVSLGEDDQGRIWTSTQRGLVYFEQGRFVPVPGVPGGFVESIVEEPAGNIWISHQKEGLFHLQYDTLIAKIPWAKLGLKENAPWLVPDPTVGLWLGFFNGGVAYLKDGQVRESYTAADGLGKGFVSHLRFDREGALWAATEGGLSRLKDGRIATLSSKNGLPCDAVQWSIEDNDQALWLQTPCGLLQVARSDLDGWAADPNHRVNATVFDSSEGVRSPGLPIGYSPVVSKATDGKLWFVTYGGAGVIDPRHLAVNKLPPPVHIEEVKVDGKVWDASHGWRLPALVRDVTIHYTALSFVAPEKIHFRYKLEGQDPDWKEVVNNREAQYTNLKPRNYRFRVMACNNSGVWNEAGDFLDFSVAPAYYQTTWFRLSCVAAFFALLWALYRYRLHQIGQEFAVRMAERTRIARELHDTLLQNFQGSLLVMQTARNILSRRPEQAGQTLDDAINMATGAVAEGRDAIQDLRSQPTVQSDLEQLLTATGQDLVHSGDANGNPVIFRVAVEGARQALDPIIQDEVYRITRELLRNAFRHSRASQIEADIRYDDRLLRVLIRDDGKGIDPKVVEAGGRAGHWGLSGMRERAKRIGARLEFWSEAGAGTEVALSIPASIAYGTSRNSRSFPLLRRKKANP